MPQNDYLPHIAYDSVIFGFSGDELKILIMEYHNTGLFALPGGFLRTDENLDEAVRRGLEERTGLNHIYLEQFYTFGNSPASATSDGHHFAIKWIMTKKEYAGCAIVVFRSLLCIDQLQRRSGPTDALSGFVWVVPVKKLPTLMLDILIVPKRLNITAKPRP